MPSLPLNEPDLTGKHILLVEDEHIVARSLGRLLNVCGATIVGPVPTVEKALALLRSTNPLDCALLDINLRGGMVFDAADALMRRGTPFAFTTGYSTCVIPERYAAVAVLQKPYDELELLNTLSVLTR